MRLQIPFLTENRIIVSFSQAEDSGGTWLGLAGKRMALPDQNPSVGIWAPMFFVRL
jgi:hypothetical protein